MERTAKTVDSMRAILVSIRDTPITSSPIQILRAGYADGRDYPDGTVLVLDTRAFHVGHTLGRKIAKIHTK